MILPARTVSLPNFFTPRRLLWLSRPLRDEPPAFLCAMTDYFAFGVFLAPPLAGAAFCVDGFSVGVPTTSPAWCWAAVASAASFAPAAGLVSAAVGFALAAGFFSAASAF